MNLRVHNGRLDGLPDTHVVLFLARTTLSGNPCFCAVYGPQSTCLPIGTDVHIHDAFLMVFGISGYPVSTHRVCHGHKYASGGGMAEIDHGGRNVSWIAAGNHWQCHFFGTPIPTSDVLIAL